MKMDPQEVDCKSICTKFAEDRAKCGALVNMIMD